jgi:hypothetical protein
MTARQMLGKPTTRWTARCLATVIHLAVTRGWPAASKEPALLAVGKDPEGHSPAVCRAEDSDAPPGKVQVTGPHGGFYPTVAAVQAAMRRADKRCKS